MTLLLKALAIIGILIVLVIVFEFSVCLFLLLLGHIKELADDLDIDWGKDR